MNKILPLYTICLVLLYLSNRSSVYDYRLGKYKYKDLFFYALLIIASVVFAGLRTNYNDTAAYITIYKDLDIGPGWLSRIDWAPGENPFFSLANGLIKKAGFSSQSFIMLYSILSIGVTLWFIRKYTNDIPLSVFLFFAMGCFGFAMAAIKQCTATAFCLIGVDRLLQNRKISFVFWVIVGSLFHPFSAMFLVCPLLLFSPWTAPTYLMIGVCAAAGFSMQTWLGNAISLLSIVGVDFDAAELTSDGVNVFRVLVVWAPVLLSFFASKFWQNSRDKANNLMMNLSTICAELMFIALFGNPVYFGRLANYFLVFQAVSIPIVLNHYEVNSKLFLKTATIVGYTGYTIYDNLLNGHTFDSVFRSVSLWKYLESIF